ncbi:MAG: DUF192 domain-containing protein [Coriobacteriales bacterium]|jgi:uncharacterized membrane protein (UPF0127 family)|nr:DUF192 domain-containing protein [Coriobacteriales bacterium]
MRRFISIYASKPLRLELAVGLWPRMRGLLDSAVCDDGEVLILVPCKSIHTFGMRESIDVAFINRQGCVLKTVRELPPSRFLSCRGASCVLERRSGSVDEWFELGDVVGLFILPMEG